MSEQSSTEQPTTTDSATLFYDPVSCYSWLDFTRTPTQATRDELYATGWRWRAYRLAYSNNARFPRFPESCAITCGGAVDYAEERAERLGARAEKHSLEATRRYEASNRIADRIPFGQPILVGHHSERGHRADLKRIAGHMNASIEESATAKRLSESAESSAKHQRYTAQARLLHQRLEADRADMAHVEAHPERYRPVQHALLIAYFTQRVEIQAARLADAGGYTPPTAESVGVQPGDLVAVRGFAATYLVQRVNKKSLSVVYREDDRRHSSTIPPERVKAILQRCPDGQKPCLACEWGSTWQDDLNARGFRIGGHREPCPKCDGTGYVSKR